MKKGFTLIELIIVMVIVTILVTIAVPKYRGAMERGRGTQAIVSVQALSDNVNAIYVVNGNTYGNDNELNALPSRAMEWGGNTTSNLFTYDISVFTPGNIFVSAERQNLGNKSYTILFVNQGGDVADRYCLGYAPYCNLLGATIPTNTPRGNGWRFE